MAVAALAQVDVKEAASAPAALLTAGPTATTAQSDPVKLSTRCSARGRRRGAGGGDSGEDDPADVAKLGLRYVNTTGRDDPALTARLREAAGLNATAKAASPQEMAAILSDVAAKGDPARGELVFRRSDTGCLTCHAVAGAGGQVGPDLRASAHRRRSTTSSNRSLSPEK